MKPRIETASAPESPSIAHCLELPWGTISVSQSAAVAYGLEPQARYLSGGLSLWSFLTDPVTEFGVDAIVLTPVEMAKYEPENAESVLPFAITGTVENQRVKLSLGFGKTKDQVLAEYREAVNTGRVSVDSVVSIEEAEQYLLQYYAQTASRVIGSTASTRVATLLKENHQERFLGKQKNIVRLAATGSALGAFCLAGKRSLFTEIIAGVSLTNMAVVHQLGKRSLKKFQSSLSYYDMQAEQTGSRIGNHIEESLNKTYCRNHLGTA